MARAKILLVDDDEAVRTTLAKVMEIHGFEVTLAADAASALKLISSLPFEVLISDLHMPGAADGLTVISAMRHANPEAITFLLSAFPDLTAAANAILLQADEVLVKPMDIPALIKLIDEKLLAEPTVSRIIETVAAILDRSIQTTVADWLRKVEKDPKLTAVTLSSELRIAYVPMILADLVRRLQAVTSLGSEPLESSAAREHGLLRRRQGYSSSMMVRESRLLQVSIFQTLQNNLHSIDFSVLLNSVMTIADEVDSQLSQAMESYSTE